MGLVLCLAIAAVVVWAIRAQFDARCPACDETIYEGDTIVNVDGEWVHEECA